MWFLSSFCSFFSFLFVLSSLPSLSPHSHPFCRSRSVSLTYTHIYTFPLPIFLIFLRTEQLGTWHWFPSAFGNNLTVAQATHIYLFCLFCILVRVFPSVRERMWNGDNKCAQVGQRAVMHVCVYVCVSNKWCCPALAGRCSGTGGRVKRVLGCWDEYSSVIKEQASGPLSFSH